jgi:hypothetical protein
MSRERDVSNRTPKVLCKKTNKKDKLDITKINSFFSTSQG